MVSSKSSGVSSGGPSGVGVAEGGEMEVVVCGVSEGSRSLELGVGVSVLGIADPDAEQVSASATESMDAHRMVGIVGEIIILQTTPLSCGRRGGARVK